MQLLFYLELFTSTKMINFVLIKLNKTAYLLHTSTGDFT